MRIFALIPLAALLGCAGVPVAQQPIDWQMANESWSVHIVTLDEDGDERVTRIWLAAVDGEGALRTGNSRWWANLNRDASCRVRVNGIDYPVRAEFVGDLAQKIRIDEAFGEKYGWMERMMFRQERGETHENYAELRSVQLQREKGAGGRRSPR